jgi:hypothetical protein
MNVVPKQSANKIEAFRIGRWRVDHLDQEMLIRMRHIADARGSTIEEVMDRALLDFVEACVADSELATKVIPFPTKRLPNRNTSGHPCAWANFPPTHAMQGSGHTKVKLATVKPSVFALLQDSRQAASFVVF